MKKAKKFWLPALVALALCLTLLAACDSSGPSGGDDSPKNYTVIFNSNGGDGVASVTKAKGSKIEKPSPDPGKADHVFGGWFYDQAFESPVDFPFTLDKNRTLYAKWDPDGTGLLEPWEKLPETPGSAFTVSAGGLITGLTQEGRSLNTIVVPAEIDGKAVVGLSGIVFAATDTNLTLETVVLPQSVESFTSSNFAYCDAIQKIHIHKENPYYSSIDGVVYDKEQTTLLLVPGLWAGSLVVPEGVEKLSAQSVGWTRLLTGVTLPDSLTEIGSFAFAGCEYAGDIVIPSKVASIGSRAFDGSSFARILVRGKSAAPSGWNSLWNPQNIPVVWNYS